MKKKETSAALRVLPLALAIHAAWAQDAAPAAAAPASAASAAQGGAAVQQVVITGVGQKTLKKDATSTINTISADEIRKLAPISTADLLQNVPGIFAEGSTAGEASNNITVRGLPVTGGYRYAPQLIDGLPWFEEPEVAFMNNDVAVRDDLMTQRVEVVKGGTGGILYSNGLGATVNHITRTGGQTFEGGYKLEVADYNFLRNDFFVSGPVNKNLTFAIGGFRRSSNGLRDVGYTADSGGQVRGNLVYSSDDGRTEVQLHALRIDDRTAFYQNVPFQIPSITQSGTPSNPTRIEPGQVWPLGVDFEHGTVASPYNRMITMINEKGPYKVDMGDGIHPDFGIYTFKLSHEFDSGWNVDLGVRHTSGKSGFTGTFVDGDTTTADRFNNARFQNDVVGASYSQAQALAANPSLNPYAYAKLSGFFNVPADPTVFAGLSQAQFASQYGKATGVAAFYADSGARVADGTLLDFLTAYVARTQADSTSTDVQLSKAFQAAGKHRLTLGGYATDYSIDQDFEQALLVSTIEGRSKLANLRAVDAGGNPVGPSLTLDGAILPGYGGYISNISAQGHALYALDHWDTLDGRLKLDIGVRRQDQRASVVRYDRNQITNVTPASVTPGSDGSTTALDEIFMASGTPRILNTKLAATGWSIGANYSLQPNLAVYGLTSKSFRLPSIQDLNDFLVAPTIPGSKIETIMQYETGVRYYADTWDTQIALFANRFNPRSQLVTYQDFTSPTCAVAGGIPQINSCPTVNEFYRIGIQNIGTEIEATWHPRAVTGLELKFGGVLQNPKVIGADYTTVKTDSTNGVVTGYEFQTIGENGRRPRRLADQMYNLQGTYDLKPLTGLPLKPYFKYTYFGSRYSEATDVNVTLYPAYYHIDGGFIWDFDSKTSFQLHVSNITNRLSFTEGDPIDPSLKGPNGATNRGVGRPLFGRIVRAMFTYFF